MDVPPSDKIETGVMGEEIDGIAASFENITLADKNSNENKIAHLEKNKLLLETDKEGHDEDIDKLKIGRSIEGDGSQSAEEPNEGENVEVDGKHSNQLNVKVTEVEKNTDSDENKTSPSQFSDKDKNIKEQLEKLHCPFFWKLGNPETSGTIFPKVIEKIKEVEEDSSYEWRHFILTLVLCCEYYHKKDIDSALIELRRCEAIVNSSESKGYIETLFQLIRNAMMHVVLSSKCCLYLEKGDLNEAEKILSSICKEEEMDNPCKAALSGIKGAASMEYGYEGTKNALDYIKEALELDKGHGEWSFLLGKCLGRIRRIDSYTDIPTLEELKTLEESVNISRNPSYILFLAQAYREAAFRVFSLNRNDMKPGLETKIDNMNQRSYDLYREALELAGNSAHVNIRCAQGLYKLPPRYKDVEKAKECCKKALELAPNNPMVHHIYGFIYEREHDYRNAKKCYEKSGELGSYGALMDLQRLEYRQDNSYNSIPTLEYMLERFLEKPRRLETLCQLGSYYFFIKNDISKAFKDYWLQVIKEDPESDKLKNHKCTLLSAKKPVSIYELLYNEASFILSTNKFMCAEYKKLLQEIVCLCLELFPKLNENSPKPLRRLILEESNQNDSSNRSRGRGGEGGNRGRGRGRGFQNRNQNQEQDRSERTGGSSSSTRFVPRNNNSNVARRPGQRFYRGTSESNWRENRED